MISRTEENYSKKKQKIKVINAFCIALHCFYNFERDQSTLLGIFALMQNHG